MALVISLFESLMPPILPMLPFAKIGLSQIIILIALVLLGTRDALIIFAIRTIFMGIFIGNISILMYAIPAGLVSIAFMWVTLTSGKLSIIAISACSASLHNLVQLIMASFIMESGAVFAYLPYLMTFGAIAGSITGFISYLVITKLPISLITSLEGNKYK